MTLIIDPHGSIRCIYDEAIDLPSLGTPQISRASHIEPDEDGQWWAELSPVDGPSLGPFTYRTQALNAERAWLERHWLHRAPGALPACC
jgi:hypothetical protein